jgi:hypothetical protein
VPVPLMFFTMFCRLFFGIKSLAGVTISYCGGGAPREVEFFFFVVV